MGIIDPDCGIGSMDAKGNAEIAYAGLEVANNTAVESIVGCEVVYRTLGVIVTAEDEEDDAEEGSESGYEVSISDDVAAELALEEQTTCASYDPGDECLYEGCCSTGTACGVCSTFLESTDSGTEDVFLEGSPVCVAVMENSTETGECDYVLPGWDGVRGT
mmetsp:Transcript_14083/g.18744  ORF Transcript_14083/g.18744 Transcript_14083/m.18744 type:complete len:161 (+) Transcript_14083:811-1293(+)